MNASHETLIGVAAAFGAALHSGDFSAAYAMLCESFASSTSPAQLAEEYALLAEDMGGVTGIGQPSVILEEWPGMAEQDVALVYVPLEGDIYSEAVTVTIAQSSAGPCLSGLEWGRP
ncbi:MAG: hypothetical protein AAGA33_05450 [Pseudomonadota bacterium]